MDNGCTSSMRFGVLRGAKLRQPPDALPTSASTSTSYSLPQLCFRSVHLSRQFTPTFAVTFLISNKFLVGYVPSTHSTEG